MDTIEVARRAVEIASDKQASNIVLLDVKNVCNFADYFVLASGDSDRQMKAIYDEIGRSLEKEGVTPHHSEGNKDDSGWMVLDYGDVIVHLFTPLEREYYQLDELWSKAKTIVRMQ
ncbi:MAG: ribosome silencing factor [Chloroflexi bacterium]|nr:ribosome silencing factor [Chloroflexota bacterium]